MIRTFKILCLALMIATLSSCSKETNTAIIELNVSEPIGSPFNKTLSREYSMLSKMFENGYLARKGGAANDGIMVMPETVTEVRWEKDNQEIIEKTEARVRLIEMMNDGGREKYPKLAALAQTRYDCWVLGLKYQQPLLSPLKTRIGYEGFSCKMQFIDAMNMIAKEVNKRPDGDGYDEKGSDDMLLNGHSFKTPTIPRPYMFPPIEKSRKGKGKLASAHETVYMAFFDWNKSNISKSASKVLDAVAEELKDRKDYKKIIIVGHTDTSGPEAYNQNLSIERAINASQALVERGIPHQKIQAEGRGEHELRVKTSDNTREPANRRVEFTLE